jgi:hypothetical protein
MDKGPHFQRYRKELQKYQSVWNIHMDNILDVKGLSKHIGKSTWKKTLEQSIQDTR